MMDGSSLFNKILIANRGEIAVRIVRACRELGVKSVAVYSEPDADSMQVSMADEAYCIGAAPPSESYLNIEKIVETAKKAGADAIHPGYGFLSQVPAFAQRCEEEGVKFIGPTSQSLRLMGNKLQARKTMTDAGVPVIPGSDSMVNTPEEALEIAEEVGYPLLLKAVFGGGGKGIRHVRSRDEVEDAFQLGRIEAKASFGNDSLYVEKYLENPRHIEFQILADEKGRTIHLNERECSIQRKHQKVVEECPSIAVDAETRRRMGKVAVKAAKAAGYTNAGTVEFLMDKDRNFYFLELNTRLQVEHLVTELVTGVDIVKQQIFIAAGEELPFTQQAVRLNGWSIECRINAEDPSQDFMPSPGVVKQFKPPGGPGVRLDAALYVGYSIPIFYDSLIAKLAVWAENRQAAISRMKRALDEFTLVGVTTNLPLHKGLFKHPNYVKGDIHINFLQNNLHEILPDRLEMPKSIEEITALTAAVVTDATRFESRAPQARAAGDAWAVAGRRELMEGKLRRGHYHAA